MAGPTSTGDRREVVGNECGLWDPVHVSSGVIDFLQT